MENLLEQNYITFTPEKCKQIALARLDLIHKWLEFNKDELNKDLNDLKSLCEKIVTIGITADIFANFFQVCTKVASYVP